MMNSFFFFFYLILYLPFQNAPNSWVLCYYCGIKLVNIKTYFVPNNRVTKGYFSKTCPKRQKSQDGGYNGVFVFLKKCNVLQYIYKNILTIY